MLEREGKKLETYSKDNKAYMNMLNRLYTASKEGNFTTSNNYVYHPMIWVSLVLCYPHGQKSQAVGASLFSVVNNTPDRG